MRTPPQVRSVVETFAFAFFVLLALAGLLFVLWAASAPTSG
jgi:hypothetical protein